MTARPWSPRCHVAPRATRLGLALAALVATSCSDKTTKDAPVNPPSLPGNASAIDIGTKVGNGRVISIAGVDVSTSTKWTRVYPIDKTRLVVAGDVAGEAFALLSNDRGSTWSAYAAKGDGIVTWSVGVDGTVVLAQAKRQIPDKPPPAGMLPPIDSLTFLFAAPGQPKMSTPVPLLAPDPKEQRPTIPRGDGLPAVLGPSLASVVVEIRPKTFAVAYVSGPGDFPAPIELPQGEVPVNAPFGHPAQLLTIRGNKELLSRPWPAPATPIAEAKVLDKVSVTKTLIDELSGGPECEWGGWSFKRIVQPGKVSVLGISPDRAVFFDLPPTTVATSPIGCSADKIIFEYTDNDKALRIATCGLNGECVEPNNKPFLKPWPEQHKRDLHMAITQTGGIAVQELRARNKWAVIMSESTDGGKLWALPRPVGEGEGGNPEDGYDVGAFVPLGDRTLMLLSAKVSKTTRRSWYAMASDDGGSTWVLP